MPIQPEYLHMVHPDTEFLALLYGRNSVGRGARSVDDQLAAGRALCAQFNWPVLEEFKDRGISASRHARKTRDDFEELLEAIESGVARIVVAYEASRYYRDLEAYVRIRNACYNAGTLLCYNGTVYDLSKKEDRKATAMDAIAAETEAEDIRDRNLRTTRRTAEAGRPHGKLPYGYARDYEVIDGRPQCARQYEHPVGGAYVLKAFEHIDSGKSLNSLVKWLKATPDAARPDGAQWTDKIVKYMLLNRVYLGERMYRGESRKATWPAVKGLDTPEGRQMFRRVGKILTDPARGEQRESRAAHLLTRLGTCGECGDEAVLKGAKRISNSRRLYTCAAKLDVVVSEDLLDAYVEEAVIRWFRDKETAQTALVPDPARTEEQFRAAQDLVETYTQELEEARSLARKRNAQGRPMLSVASLSVLEQDLLPKIEQAQASIEADTGVPGSVQRLLSAKDPATVWDGTPATEVDAEQPGLTLEQKREVIRLVVNVRLHKATGRSRAIEEGRVRLAFRGEPGFRDRPHRVRGIVPAQAAGRPAGRGTVRGSE